MVKRLILTPIQKFVRIQSFSGILLFIATVSALIWANSPFLNSYHALWDYKLGFSSESFSLTKPLILWINDGLMAVFFFLIGLEIKRELIIGELNSLKKATFPLIAAFGGMLFPMLSFMFLNRNPDAAHGWGIPMATDIAFTLAILSLLGKRVPLSLKIFLMAFAIVDDIGAVLVIAFFYSAGVKWSLLLIAIAMLGFLFFLAYRKIYIKYLVLAFGIIIWVLFLKAGIHPTIAGVLMAFTIPLRQKINVRTYTRKLGILVEKIKVADDSPEPVLTKNQIDEIDNLEDWTNMVQSPLQHLEHRLHNWVSYLIMPLFALANAGVTFSSGTEIDFQLMLVIALSLVAGNFLGVSAMTFFSVKLKIASLPSDFKVSQVVGVAFLAGVGFTMSMFIANLAFSDHLDLMDSTKAGILLGSIIAGITGYLVLRFNSGTKEEMPQSLG